MTAAELFHITENTDIRNAFSDISAAFSRNPEIQKTLLAHAWIAIAEMPKGYITSAYIGRGYAVMRHKYEIYYMAEPTRYPSDDPSIRRAGRVLRNYL